MKTLWIILVACFLAIPARAQLIEALENPNSSKEVPLPNVRPSEENPEPEQVSRIEQGPKATLEKTSRSNDVYSREGWGGDSVPNYCRDQCACLAKKIREVLDRTNIPHRTLTVRTAFRRGLNVRIRDRANLAHEYNYHMVIVVKVANRWRVIDPLMLRTARPERLSVWLRRIETRDTNVADIY